jgi:hypothetical protein
MSISLTAQYTQRNYRWTDWKVVQVDRSLVYQYNDDGFIYKIWGYDGPEVHFCIIYKDLVPESAINAGYSQAQNDSDKLDFETNYIPGADEPIGTPITGSSDGTKIGNIDDRLKVADEDVVVILNTISTGEDISSDIIKKNEVSVAVKTEFDLTNTNYTVPTGKKFLLHNFSASYDAQAIIYVRLKKQTGGSGPFETILRLTMMNGGQGDSTINNNLGTGLNIGAPGDVFKITIEASLAKGTIWAMYSGNEF